MLDHCVKELLVSIHAPRAGGDIYVWIETAYLASFNPRPPRGGRLQTGALRGEGYKFQSTPPARGATRPRPDHLRRYAVSIHAPRAGGDPTRTSGRRKRCGFQSTPPARGATAPTGLEISAVTPFQSTPPARGATLYRLQLRGVFTVSIHAPRAGGDISLFSPS